MIKGIDTSHHQGDKGAIDWKKVQAAGYAFAFLKATESVDFKDGQYTRDRKEARAAGIIVGHYHFARGGDAKREADFFLSVVGEIKEGEPLILDWEIKHPDPVKWCLAWLQRVEEKTGVKPLLYTNEARVTSLDWTPVVKEDFGLWVAKYGINDGHMNEEPKIGKWPFVAIWQYTSAGTVPGIVGNVDLDVAYMSADTLKKYGKRPAAATPTPAPAKKYFCQQDYPDVMLGKSKKYTIASDGCKLVSIANITGIDPVELNKKLADGGAFFANSEGDVCLLDDTTLAKILGWKFIEKTTTDPKKVCVAEVDMSPAPGKQQHFVEWTPDGIIDPWTGTARPATTYPIVSFRVFEITNQTKEPMIAEELKTAIEQVVGKDYGDNFSESEQKKAADLLTLTCEDANSAVKKSVQEIDDLHQKNKGLESKVAELEKQLAEKPGIESLSVVELLREIVSRVKK